MINQEWKIKSRGHACGATGREFVDGEVFFTALFEDPAGDGFVRRDYSAAAWEAGRDGMAPFSYWRSVFEEPEADPKPADLTERAGAEALLRRLIDEDDPGTDNARFILAVMLERRKLLRETDQRSLGPSRLRIYEHVRTGDVFIIRDPQLRLDQIDEVQREVADLLGARGPGAGGAAAEGGVPEAGRP
jgi:hypothetical protein